MDIHIILFLIVGFGSMILAFILEGGTPGALLVETAAMIVFGGTIGTIGVAFPFKTVKKFPASMKIAFTKHNDDLLGKIIYFMEISKKTRQNGLLTLETDLNDPKMDRFVKKGLQLVVDGVEPTTLKNILDLEVEMTIERHKECIAMFEAAGGFAPTMGIIGTVMGLVQVLSNLSDPNSLGPKIAVAFIATLYGVGSANLLWLPIASKLKIINMEELKEKELIIDAVICIQEGLNPNTIGEKLKGYLDTKQVLAFERQRSEGV